MRNIVYFIGDSYRGAQAQNIRNLFEILSPVVNAQGAKSVLHISPINCKTDLNDWIGNWVRSLRGEQLSVLKEIDINSSAVIAFELSSVDRNYLNSVGIPWVSIEIHPLRFLEDLYLDVDASFGIDFSQLEAPEDYVTLRAQVLRAKYRPPNEIAENRLLIVGQAPVDKTVFFDDEFKNLAHYIDTADKIAAEFDAVDYRPHPYWSDPDVDSTIKSHYSAGDCAGRNIYKILVGGRYRAVAGISSSVLREAPYFGLRSFVLEPRSRKFGSPISYRQLILKSDIWLSGLLEAVLQKRPNDLLPPIPDNHLRRVFCSWSYVSDEEEINLALSSVNRRIEQQDAVRQSALDMSSASAQREASLQEEVASLRVKLEQGKAQALARERQQQEAFSLAREELRRQAQAELQVVLDRERELAERLLQQQDAVRQSALDMSSASAQREASLQEEVASLRVKLEQGKAQALARERQQQEAFSLAREELRRQAQAELQVVLDRERELAERLLQQQDAFHRVALETAAASSECQATLQARADEKLSHQLKETHHFHLECEALAGKLALEQERSNQSAVTLAVHLARFGEVQAELDRLQRSWSWRITAPFRLFKCSPRSLHLSPPTQTPIFTVPNSASMLAPSTAPIAKASLEAGIDEVETPCCALDSEAAAKTHFQTESTQQKVTAMSTEPSLSLDELFAFPSNDYIDNAYRILLNRAPDTEGMVYYQKRLREGYGRASVLIQLAKSPECSHALDKLLTVGSDEFFIEMLYRRYLGRPSDRGGREFYQESLKNGAGRKKVARDIRLSQEALTKNTIWSQLDQMIDVDEKSRHWLWRWFVRRERVDQRIFQQHEVLIGLLADISNGQIQTSRRLERIESYLIKKYEVGERTGGSQPNEYGVVPQIKEVTTSDSLDACLGNCFPNGGVSGYGVNAQRRTPLEAYLQRKGAQ